MDDAGFAQLKERMRSTWIAGDFGRIAEHMTQIGEEFVEQLNIEPGMKVLDVACGTGNTALPAARSGAQVIGVDIAANLLEQARKRAAEEGLPVRFDEGDAEQLPYADGEFDVVLTMFGAMFAPRPERVAAELARVCRQGGRVAMANWTREGFIGKMFALGARYLPPPEGLPPPVLWGDEKTVRERFAGVASGVETVRRPIEMRFPFPPRDVVQYFRDYFGPTKVAFARLDTAQQEAYAKDLERLWSDGNRDREGTNVEAEYLEVIATRA